MIFSYVNHIIWMLLTARTKMGTLSRRWALTIPEHLNCQHSYDFTGGVLNLRGRAGTERTVG